MVWQGVGGRGNSESESKGTARYTTARGSVSVGMEVEAAHGVQ